jgi:cytoskeletal protein CcmA (bactofilin family)
MRTASQAIAREAVIAEKRGRAAMDPRWSLLIVGLLAVLAVLAMPVQQAAALPIVSATTLPMGVALRDAFVPAAAGAAEPDTAKATCTPEECTTKDDDECGACWQGGVGVLFSTQDRFVVSKGETEERDLYLLAERFDVFGTVDGDVFIWTREARIEGTVTGDLNIGAETVRITGEIEDDLRVGCKDLYIDGTVGGHVLAGCANIYIGEDAVIEGDLILGCGVTELDGEVGGSAAVGTGVFNMEGTINGNAEIRTDGGMNLGPDAHIGGDLRYESPYKVDIDPGAVAGSVRFIPMSPDEDIEEFTEGLSKLKVAWHFLSFLAALIAGTIILALTRSHANRTAEIIRTKPLKSLGIGFIAYICIPIVLLILLLLVITIPLMLVVLLAYLIALYIAKFYVAIWLGNLILRRGGQPDVSPIPGFLLGIVLVYLVTWIPVVGTLIGIVIIFFGLGALLQRKETRLDAAFETPPPAAPGALPNVFPGSAPPKVPPASPHTGVTPPDKTPGA